MKSPKPASRRDQSSQIWPLLPNVHPVFKGWAYREDRWTALFDVGELTAYADEAELERLAVSDPGVFQKALRGTLNGVPPWGSLPSEQDIRRGERLAADAISLLEYLPSGSPG